jgi:hypothetical protein
MTRPEGKGLTLSIIAANTHNLESPQLKSTELAGFYFDLKVLTDRTDGHF